MENLKKMTLDHRVFENERFLTKQGHESKVYLRKLTFLTKYGHESSDFS